METSDLVKKFKKMSTSQLLSKVETLKGLEKDACVEVLTQRGEMNPITIEDEKVVATEPVSECLPIIEPTPETGTAPVYEAEPETELTAEEQALIDEATSKLDFDPASQEVVKPVATLLEKVTEHITNFKKGTPGFNKIKLILRDRKLNKLSDPEMKIILSVPLDKVVETVSKPKADKPKSDKPETEKKKSDRKAKVLTSAINPLIHSGVKVKFTLNSRRGGAEATGVVSHIHVKGDKEFVLIKTDVTGIIVSKVPKNLTIIE